jgi:hypothetical protein
LQAGRRKQSPSFENENVSRLVCHAGFAQLTHDCPIDVAITAWHKPQNRAASSIKHQAPSTEHGTWDLETSGYRGTALEALSIFDCPSIIMTADYASPR